MDTERYVKCGWLGKDRQLKCKSPATQWIVIHSVLCSRCDDHKIGYITPTFTNLQDALAALAMERL